MYLIHLHILNTSLSCDMHLKAALIAYVQGMKQKSNLQRSTAHTSPGHMFIVQDAAPQISVPQETNPQTSTPHVALLQGPLPIAKPQGLSCKQIPG